MFLRIIPIVGIVLLSAYPLLVPPLVNYDSNLKGKFNISRVSGWGWSFLVLALVVIFLNIWMEFRNRNEANHLQATLNRLNEAVNEAGLKYDVNEGKIVKAEKNIGNIIIKDSAHGNIIHDNQFVNSRVDARRLNLISDHDFNSTIELFPDKSADFLLFYTLPDNFDALIRESFVNKLIDNGYFSIRLEVFDGKKFPAAPYLVIDKHKVNVIH